MYAFQLAGGLLLKKLKYFEAIRILIGLCKEAWTLVVTYIIMIKLSHYIYCFLKQALI